MSDLPTERTSTDESMARELLERESGHLRRQLSELVHTESGSSFDENFADSGQVAAEQGENRVLASQLRDQLDDVERALGKLDDGSYGQCEICGAPISEARLEVMPAARFCIDHTRPADRGVRRVPPGSALMAQVTHLVKRGVLSLVPLGPSRPDEAWAVTQLLDGERALWRRMSRNDRRHAVGVARRTSSVLGDRAERPVLAAALLHDVGKIEARFGVYRRTMATLSGIAVRHDPDVIRDWTRTTGFTRRVGLYLDHARLGGDLLGIAASDPLTEAWAREHHMPEGEWTVPLDIGRVLKEADDD